MSLFERADELADRGEPVAMLTVTGKDGSAPREVGARMLVTDDDEFGTIGGGVVEGLAIEEAREVLDRKADPGIQTYELRPGGNTGMVCGGSMDVFIDRIRGRRHLYVAGCGHISTDLAEIGEILGYDVTVVDDREEYADPQYFPDDTRVIHGDYGEELGSLPMTEETAVAVATRSGTFDERAIAAAIDGGAGYIGLVASDTKADRVLSSLEEEGYDPMDLARVRAPIGLNLGGGDPQDVALSILSEIHRDRYGTSGSRMTRVNIDDLVVVRGGGDLASGAVYRLFQTGFPVIVTEVEQPSVVRRDVSFGTAMYEDEFEVEDLTARRADEPGEALSILRDGEIPVLKDPDATIADELDPIALVDATMAKGRWDTGTRRDDADVVIGLGPGFEAGEDVDAVVESHRGHALGRVYYEGTASDYDGIPDKRHGFTQERVLRAPSPGMWEPVAEIGDIVEAGDTIGHVGDDTISVEIDGRMRGLAYPGLEVEEGAKLGDVDPRGENVDHTKVSDKALGIGGGVLEAIMRLR